jgi:hypothetical protein
VGKWQAQGYSLNRRDQGHVGSLPTARGTNLPRFRRFSKNFFRGARPFARCLVSCRQPWCRGLGPRPGWIGRSEGRSRKNGGKAVSNLGIARGVPDPPLPRRIHHSIPLCPCAHKSECDY